MTTHSEAEQIAEAVQRRYRRNALRAIVKAEEHLDAAFRDLAATLREELAVQGLDEEQVLDAIVRAFARMSPERLRRIEAAIHDAAANGIRAPAEMHRRIFGTTDDAHPDERPFAPASDSPATQKPSLRLLRGSGGSSPATG